MRKSVHIKHGKMSFCCKLAVPVLLLLLLVCIAIAADVFHPITSEGTHQIKLSQNGSTILRINFGANMDKSDAVGVKFNNLPVDAPDFDLFGSYCVPWGYATTRHFDTVNDNYYNNFCGTARCNGIEMEFAACPYRRTGGCDYFVTIPYRSDMTLSVTVRMTGFTFVDAQVMDGVADIPVDGVNHFLSNVQVVGKKALNYMIKPTAALKHMMIKFTSVNSVMQLRLGTNRMSPYCLSNTGPTHSHATSGTLRYDEFSDCDDTTWVNQPTLYLAVILPIDTTTVTSSMTFSMSTLLFSYENAIRKSTFALGDKFRDLSPEGESAFYEINVGTVNYPGAVVLELQTDPSPDGTNLEFEIMRSRAEGFCKIRYAKSSLVGNQRTTNYVFGDGWYSPAPSILRLAVRNSGSWPVIFNVTVSATSSEGAVVVQQGQEFNLTTAPWVGATHYPIADTLETTTGYLELTMRNFESSLYGLGVRVSRAGKYSSEVYCYAPGQGSCISNIPVCTAGVSSSPLSLHINNKFNRNMGFTARAKEYTPLVPGQIIPAGTTRWFAYTYPTGYTGPVKIRLSALLPVGHTSSFSTTVQAMPAGACSGQSVHNTCYLSIGQLTCEMTMACQTDVLMFQSDTTTVDMRVDVSELGSSVPVLDGSVPGATFTLPSSTAAYNETYVKLTLPAGTTSVTLRMYAPQCETCYYCTQCVSWARVDGCTVKPLGYCDTNDCYHVLDVTSTELLLKARVYLPTASASITVVRTSGCQVPEVTTTQFCTASINYPVWPGARFTDKDYLDAGASKLMSDLEAIYSNEVNPNTYCYAAIKHMACVDNYPVCKAPIYGAFVSTCKEFCQDLLAYCPTNVREKLAFLCNSAPTCADVQPQPPAFIPPPPLAVAPTLPTNSPATDEEVQTGSAAGLIGNAATIRLIGTFVLIGLAIMNL